MSEFKFIIKEFEENAEEDFSISSLLEIAYQLRRIADEMEAGKFKTKY